LRGPAAVVPPRALELPIGPVVQFMRVVLGLAHERGGCAQAWLIPPMSGVMDDLDLSLLDPADEEERRVLLLAEHPELWEAIEGDVDEILIEGVLISPRLHLAVHQEVASQIWQDDPPEMWTTAQRLTDAGYDRHEVLHMLGSVVSRDLYNAMTGNAPVDLARTRRELAALPGSWEAPAPALSRAARRAHARRRLR
jgi:hypothetical protein